MYECDRCGESTFSAEQDKLVSDLVKRKTREKMRLLGPEEILGIRKRCNLTQEELEHLFGLGRKVVIRWEKGRVMQSKTADVLLRLLDRNPAIIDELRRIQEQREVSATP
jgi:putative zinc finger/helix-turn-helix YgiT family protein